MNHALQGLADLKQDDLKSFLTSVSVPKLPQKTQEAWLQYSKHVKEMPDVQMFFYFLQEKLTFYPMLLPLHLELSPPRTQETPGSVQSSPSR